jgi:NitT/TauT family transport system substrate-binding protein
MNRTRFAGSAAAALAAPAVPRAALAVDAPLLRLAAPANDTATSALYAVHAGLYTKVGLNVDLKPMNSGAAATAAVAGGAVDVGLSSLITLIAAHGRGLPFTLIAPSGIISSDVPFTGFLVRKDAPIASGRDLNGKTVASPALRDLNAIASMAWIDANGGDSQSVRFVELSQPASIAALDEGRIDGMILGTPTLTEALATGKFRVLADAFTAVSKRFEHIAWFTTTDYAAKSRDTLVRFARVMHDAGVYVNAHTAETAPLVAEFDKVDLAVVQRMVRVPFAPYLDRRMIQPLIDVAYKYKVIDRNFDASEMISPLALKAPH